jgi:protein-S-isoprenylcysteine O-methyltransferase Ste14
MSLLRIPFVLSAAWALRVSERIPNPSPEEAEKRMPTGSESIWVMIKPWTQLLAKVHLDLRFLWPYLTDFLQASWGIWPLLEVVTIVANATPSLPLSSKIISIVVRSNPAALAASTLRITPIFLVGWFLTVSGGLIRLFCYRAMGRMFTSELAIRKEHKLITSGPYSVVRHPGYTAIFMIHFGYSICLMGHGSWLRECSGLSLDGTLTRALIAFWVTTTVFLLWVFVSRTKTEDDMLRKEFSDWDKWARKVPYKLIPLIY